MRFNKIRTYISYYGSSMIYYNEESGHWIDINTGVCYFENEIKNLENMSNDIILSNQEAKILNHIAAKGFITSFIAVTHLHIVALTTRISEMRAKGIPILSKTVRYDNTADEHIHYNIYYLREIDIPDNVYLKRIV